MLFDGINNSHDSSEKLSLLGQLHDALRREPANIPTLLPRVFSIKSGFNDSCKVALCRIVDEIVGRGMVPENARTEGTPPKHLRIGIWWGPLQAADRYLSVCRFFSVSKILRVFVLISVYDRRFSDGVFCRTLPYYFVIFCHFILQRPSELWFPAFCCSLPLLCRLMTTSLESIFPVHR